jgi:hypothetical protein
MIKEKLNSMLIRLNVFFEYPVAVRYALGLLIGGWISVYAFMYHINLYFPDLLTSNEVMRVVIVGIGICYCVIRIKPWARKLCLFFNLGIIYFYVVFLSKRLSSIGVNSSGLSIHAFFIIALFGICTYYLLIKETTEYFKAHEPRKYDEDGKEILETTKSKTNDKKRS